MRFQIKIWISSFTSETGRHSGLLRPGRALWLSLPVTRTGAPPSGASEPAGLSWASELDTQAVLACFSHSSSVTQQGSSFQDGITGCCLSSACPPAGSLRTRPTTASVTRPASRHDEIPPRCRPDGSIFSVHRTPSDHRTLEPERPLLGPDSGTAGRGGLGHPHFPRVCASSTTGVPAPGTHRGAAEEATSQ